MKLSTKGRYGLKAMVDLATEYDSGARLSIAQLAERQGVSAALQQRLFLLRTPALAEIAKAH